MKRNIFALILLTGFCASCSDDDTPSTQRAEILLTPTEKSMVEATYSFGLDLLTEIARDNDNHIISPTSLSMTLSMTGTGTNGDTRDEILELLDLDGQTIESINSFNKKLISSLPHLDHATTVKLANSLWINKQQESHLQNEYAATILDNYNAQVTGINLSSKNAIDEINKWCSENTSGMLPQIVTEPIDPDAMMVFINALYFKGKWKKEFDKTYTRKENFTNASGATAYVSMMNAVMDLDYLSNDKYMAVAFPFGNTAYSMIVILPAESKTINQCISDINFNDIIRLSHKDADNHLFEVKLPRFEISYISDFTSSLKNMGMSLAFTDEADFSNMWNGLPARLSTVIHSTKIIVDESGAEAAAVTINKGDMAIGPTGAMQFYVNRPFIVAITEQSTGIPLLMGCVNRLKQE